jgi:iron complex transport system permease protein
MKTRRSQRLLAAGALALLAAAALPWIGAERIDPATALRVPGSVDAAIFWGQRVPRVLLALAVGGGLAVAGTALQVLFRNPLAEPWTLGIAGGASLGAFLGYLFPVLRLNFGPFSSVQVLSLCGAAAVLAAIWGLCRHARAQATQTLLLGGVTISIFCGGVVMLLTYFVSPFEFMSVHRWMIGGLDVLGYRDLAALATLLTPGLLILFGRMREYNHLSMGEDLAAGQGVDVARTHRLTVAGVGLVTAAVVAFAGPIGFVGMLVPHAARALTGADHRFSMPAAFVLGGTVLAVCDTVARTLLAPTELPVGVITAVCGAPVFLLILFRRR